MSINTNIPEGLPSVETLQEIANQYFKALPNEVPKEISLDPYNHPKSTALAKSLLEPDDDITNHQNSFNLNSISGIGVSPSLDQYTNWDATPSEIESNVSKVNAIVPNHQENNFFNDLEINRSSFNGGIPSSIAGSGIPPSYTHQQQNFSKENPITSFPDENIDKKENLQADPFHLSFMDDIPFFSDIDTILNQINIKDQTLLATQHNLSLATISEPSYYFLNEDVNSQIAQQGTLYGFDAYKVKKDFPILNEKINGKPLVWFDNAATTQKPQLVIDRMNYFYQHENSNIHRAAHELAARATDAYEAARNKVQVFIGAKSANEIIFVRGATEGINLVANSWGEQYLKSGDEIIVSNLEHHANIVPWKRLADRKGLVLKVIPVNDDGQIILEEYAKLLTTNTKLVSITQVSNALGTVTPAEQIVKMAHAVGARVLVDGAQSVSHMPVNVQTLDADWFVFSGHKVFGPTGIGVLYGREELLNATEPWQAGGNMIEDVTFETIKYHKAPNRFEAGTGNIADAVGLGAAIDYVTALGMPNIAAYEHALLDYATQHILQISGVRLIGTAQEKASVLSFTLNGYSNDDVGKALDKEGIAVRTGHHCAQPILRRMGVETTVRPSLAFYNTCEDVDRFIDVLKKLVK